MTDRYIRCRFCDYRVRPISRAKGGRVISGWMRLQKHIEYKHAAELSVEEDKIEDYMREKCGGR